MARYLVIAAAAAAMLALSNAPAKSQNLINPDEAAVALAQFVVNTVNAGKYGSKATQQYKSSADDRVARGEHLTYRLTLKSGDRTMDVTFVDASTNYLDRILLPKGQTISRGNPYYTPDGEVGLGDRLTIKGRFNPTGIDKVVEFYDENVDGRPDGGDVADMDLGYVRALEWFTSNFGGMTFGDRTYIIVPEHFFGKLRIPKRFQFLLGEPFSP